MKIVKWISDDEITLYCEESKDLADLKALSLKLYKHPRVGRRTSEHYFYLRYESQTKYSTGSYEFPDNPILEDLCKRLNAAEFVFWGTFKTEIAPQHFMEHLHRTNKLQDGFRFIEAGEEQIKTAINPATK